jgi:hypothetical protein
VAIVVLVGQAITVAAAPAGASVSISSSTLAPPFHQPDTDYVVRCDDPVELRIELDRGARARVGKDPWSGRSRTKAVTMMPGQAIRIHTRRPDAPALTYTVRCLPGDFPGYTFKRLRAAAAPLYLVTPGSTGPGAPSGGYAVVFTGRGAPIWWMRDEPSPFDFTVLPDGTFAWTTFQGGIGVDPDGSYVLRRPSGRVVGQLRTTGSPTDVHDLQLRPDGNYMLISYRPRSGVDTSVFNGNSDATIYDGVIQTVTPTGELVGEWSTEDHVNLNETPTYRWESLDREPYDTTHVNSVEPLKNGDFIISLRHTDAVYRVDGATGALEWKLGGTPTPNSLQVVGDPRAYPLAAQHDARWLGHGQLSVHDNGGGAGPRVVIYRIGDGVATYVDSYADPLATFSACCGSARKVADNWLVSWGGVPVVTEFDAEHRRVFLLSINGTGTSYRAVAIDGELTEAHLRRGMDAQARTAAEDGG